MSACDLVHEWGTYHARTVNYSVFEVPHDAIEAKLKSFESLSEGWHFGSGSKVSTVATGLARELIKLCRLFGYTLDIFPGVDADMLIALRKDSDYLEIAISADGSMDFFKEVNGEKVERGESVSKTEILKLISVSGSNLWSTYVSYIQDIGSQQNSDLSDLLLRTPVRSAVEGYQLLMPNAQPLPRERLVGILPNITRPSPPRY